MVQENEKTRVYAGYLWLVTLSALSCAACAGGPLSDGSAPEMEPVAQEKATVAQGEETVLTHPVRIDVVNGAVVAGSNGGNVRNSRHPRVRWTSRHEFALEFFLVHEEGAPLRADLDPRWPFTERKPKDGIVKLGAGGSFEGTISSPARTGQAVYKYYITVTTQTNEVYRLDPIIIIE